MALRIGALILATCNLLSASVLHSREDPHLHEHVIIAEHRENPYSHLYGDHEVLPTPGIIVGNYNIGGSENRKESSSYHREEDSHGSRSERPSSNHKEDVVFKPLRYEETGSTEDKKAPITVVTVPRVSTAPPTRHQVVQNHVQNHPNLPENKEYSNKSAKQELLSYDNLLKTSIKPVKEVREVKDWERHEKESCDSDSDHHHRYPTVGPSRLQRYTDKQIAVGEARQYANPVIKSFTVSTPHEGRHDSEENLHRDWNIWHEHQIPSQNHQSRRERDSNQNKERRERDSGDHKDWNYPVITKNLNIVVHHEENNKEAHDWSNGWLGNGKQ